MSYNICFIINSLNGGGAENVVSRMSNYLVSLEHKVTIFLLHDDIKYSIDDKIIIKVLSGKSRKDKAISLKEEYLKSKYDLSIAFLHGAHTVVKYSGLKNIYMSVRNYESTRLKEQGFLKYLSSKYKMQKLYKGEKILTVCDAVKDDLLENIKIKPESIQTIYNPYNFQLIHEQSAKSDENILDTKYIVLVGSFNSTQKRQDIAIEVMNQIPDEYHLVFLGEGKLLKEYKQLVHQNKLEDRVHFIGWLQNPYPWIKQAKLLLMVSDFEGFPNVVLESLIVGTPVVARYTQKSGISEILKDEYSQFVVKDDQNYTSLGKQINEVLEEPYDINEKLYKNFNDANIVQEYLSLIN